MLVCIAVWALIAGKETRREYVDDFGDKIVKVQRTGVSADLPSPGETWTRSKLYITQPLAKRGEMDQGILRFTWLSLTLVVQGYAIALLIGTPLGFFLGLSKIFTKMFDPIFQVLRPVSRLAWLPLGVVLFLGAKVNVPGTAMNYTASDLAAIFTIAVCSMWPTVLNTAVGVRAIPQDYLNVARVLKLSKTKTLFKVLLPATLPYMFTGFRLSLGIARHRSASLGWSSSPRKCSRENPASADFSGSNTTRSATPTSSSRSSPSASWASSLIA